MSRINISTLFFVFFLSIVSCSNASDEKINESKEVEVLKESDQTKTSVLEDINAEEFRAKMSTKDIIILDVRTQDEVANGSIQGAINIDFYSSDFKAKLNELDKSKTILVYCAAGGRSGKAAKMLHENKFSTVYNLLGGYGQWPYKQ